MGTVSNPAARQGNRAARELNTWWAAWRDLSNNPVYMYFALAERRRLLRVPLWRRLLLPGLLFLGAMAYPATMVDEFVYDLVGGYLDSLETLAFVLYAVLWTLGAVWTARLVPVIFETALGVMGFLSWTGAKHKGPRVDDSIAATGLSDLEVTVAAIRLFWPRLAWFSLGGALLLVAYLVSMESHLRDVLLHDEVSWILLLSPLTVATLALAGALGGLIYVLWLLALGNGMRTPLFASLTGALCGLGYVAYIPLMAAFFTEVLSAYGFGGSSSEKDVWNVLFAVGHTVMIVLGCYLLYLLAERFQGVRTFLAPGTPLLFLLGGGLHFLLYNFLDKVIDTYRADELTGVSAVGYLISWSGTVVFNPFAVPLAQCYGWDWDEWWFLSLEWFRYPLLLLLQLSLVVTGLHFARRAVRLRRCAGE